MPNRFKVRPLTLAVLLVSQGLTTATFAQNETTTSTTNVEGSDGADSDQNQTDPKKMEEVLVTGYRGSVLQALRAKQNAQNITDSIFAEDIGKSTDQNIADALSRITGVSVQTEDGEGTKVTVRGANPNQNIITLNGVALTSSDFNQSVDLSTFSSDILKKIEVVKTSSADQDEGSLGASINLSTQGPLDFDGNKKTFTVQGRYSDFSDEVDHKFSGLISQKFADDKAGVLFTAYSESDHVRKDQFRVNTYNVTDVRLARDTEGNVVSGMKALAPSGIGYSLFQNVRSRQGGTLSLQFQPSDSTDIRFDVTASEQTVVDASYGINVGFPANDPNHVQGVESSQSAQNSGDRYVPSFSDPQQDWWTIDLESRTLVKSVNRFGAGSMSRNNGGNTTDNLVASFSLEHDFGDAVTVNFGLSRSETDLEFLPDTRVSSASWNRTPLYSVVEAGPEGSGAGAIEPVGFDCTKGSLCQIVHGNGRFSLGDPALINDNVTTTGFNPFDLSAQHLGFMGSNQRDISDEISTAFFDIDWNIDLGIFHQIEAGVKVSQRTKKVDDQQFRFFNTKQPVIITDFNERGEPINASIQSGQGITDITVSTITNDDKFPYDDFMSSLGTITPSLSNGWALFSSDLAFQKAFGNEDLDIRVDKTRSREAELKNQAAYLKFNFETDIFNGDIGLRYVRTEVETLGYSGLNYHRDRLERAFDPFTHLQLRNNSNPACEPASNNDSIQDQNGDFVPNPGGGNQRRNSRIDGLGWNLNGTDDDLTDDVPIPAAAYPCYDAVLEGNPGWWAVWRHSDISTSENSRTDKANPDVVVDRSRPSILTRATHDYSLLLPSLNLIFPIKQDEYITRFSVSRTMARPNIDDLKPGFRLNEYVWGAREFQTINLSSTNLDPQKSTNLDLSFEWYFNDEGNVSVALFHKELTDFLEAQEIQSYAADLRNVDFESGIDPSKLLLTEEQVNAGFAADPQGFGVCMPQRAVLNQIREDWFRSDDLLEKCATFRVSQQRNGSEGSISGVELQYSQNFDFLPGIWSGLGTHLNYTYQQSEAEAEISSIDGVTLLPEFPQAWTPEHSYNATFYWEQNGHLLRFAYRGKSDELIRRTENKGALWREGNGTFDISATYKISDNASLSFNVINLTNESTRDYFTSRFFDLGDRDADGNVVPFEEGNALDGGVTKSRTRQEYTTGARYRLSLQLKF